MKKLLIVLFVLVAANLANAQTWFREGFDVALAPADTTPSSWSQGFISGSTLTFPNGFKRYTVSANPATAPFTGGYLNNNGMIKYNNRGIAYPTASGAAAGNSAILVSPPLDWTGRTVASPGWASFRFWRDNSLTGGVQNVSDSIEVFINTRPDLVGAILLTESTSSSTQIPRSTYLAPQSVPNTTALWQLEKYALPAFGSYTTIDTSSSVYFIIKATCAGGNNMYIDSVNLPTYPTTMALQGSEIFYQETADLGKGTTDNLILGVRIWAHGSINPQSVDSLLFLTNGSTSPLSDIAQAKLWYTSSYPSLNLTAPWAKQYDVAASPSNISFGYGSSGTCTPLTVTTPASLKCKAGWNYFWLTYDITAGATAGDFVDADFVGYNGGTPVLCNAFRTVNLSAVGGRQIVGCISPTPVITPSGPTTFCQPGSVTLTCSTSPHYLWTTGATTQSITVATSGIFIVTATDLSGCSVQSSPLTVNAGITASISANGATTFCQGDSVQLTCTLAPNYTWTTGATTKNISVKTAGNYYAVVSDGNGCTALTNAITVTVKTLPTATITPNGPTTFCNGGSVTLTSSTGAAYLWSTGASTKTIVVSTTGTYTVTVTKANGCSKKSSSTSVNVIAPTSAAITANGPTTFCYGDSVTLASNTASSYLWSNGKTTQSIVVKTSGAYYVTISGNGGCTFVSNTINVTANQAAIPVISASGPVTFCPGQNVILTCSASASYAWSTGAINQSIAVSTPGTFIVTVTDIAGCTASAAATVTVTCPKPIGLTTTNITATSAKVGWNKVSCAANYRLQYRVNGITTWTTVSGILNNYKNITGLLSATQYNWRVATKCPDGTFAAYTGIQNFTTLGLRSGNSLITENINDVNLYPNPGTDVVYLQAENPIEGQLEISVYDMTDRKIVVGVIKADAQTYEINIQTLAAGAYTVVLTTTTSVQKRKLIVAR